jgi:hypothetical protein
MHHLTRRQFRASTVAVGAASAASALLMPVRALAEAPTIIRVGNRVIEVKGKPAKVFGLIQPDGTHGHYTQAGRRFRVTLEAGIEKPTLIHWHGLTPPMEQDGVPDLSQPPLEPGGRYHYDFPLTRPGTNWMHSHLGLQRTPFMRALFRNTVQRIDGVQDTDPNARGLLPTLMREAGFAEIAETHVVPTPTGSIPIYRAAAMNEKGSCPQTNERTVR